MNKAKAIADLKAVSAAGKLHGGKMQAVFKKIGKVAKVAFAVVGVAAAAIFVLAIKKAAAFEASMSMVKAVTGATEKQFAALEKKAKELGRTSKFVMTDIAAGMEFLGRAGFTTTEIISAMDGVVALAASQVMDLGRAADITSNILTGMNLEASEASRVADVLAQTAASANVNVEMLGDSFKYCAPLAAAAGWSIEETAAAIGKMGDAGIQGSMAGTALRMALSELIGETENFTDKLGELGMTMDDLKAPDGQLLGMAEVMGVFEEAGFGAAEMIDLFGKRAGPGMIILLAQGEEALANYTAELEASRNELELIYVQTGFVATGADLLRQQIEALTAVFLSVDEPIANARERAEELITAVSDGTMSFAEFEDAITEAGVDLDKYGDFTEIAYKNLTTLADETQQAEVLTTKLAEALVRGGLSTKEAASLAKKLAIAVRDGTMSFEEFEAAIEAAGADMDVFGGMAQRMADIYLETLAGQVDVLKGSWDLLLVTIGEDLMPILSDFLEDTIIPLVNKMADWARESDTLKTKFKAFLDKVKGGIEWIIEHREGLVTGLKAIAAGFAAIIALKAAIWVKGIVTALTGPVGLIAALALLGIAIGRFLKKHTPEIAEGMGRIRDKVKEVTGGFIDLGVATSEAYRRAEEDTDKLKDAMENLTPNVTAAFVAVGDLAEETGRMSEELERSEAAAKKTGETVCQGAREQQTAYLDMKAAVDEWRASREKATDATDEGTEATEEGTEATEEAVEAVEEHVEASEEQAEAIQEVTVAEEEEKSKTEELRESYQELKLALDDSTEGTAEYADAVQGLQGLYDGLSEYQDFFVENNMEVDAGILDLMADIEALGVVGTETVDHMKQITGEGKTLWQGFVDTIKALTTGLREETLGEWRGIYEGIKGFLNGIFTNVCDMFEKNRKAREDYEKRVAEIREGGFENEKELLDEAAKVYEEERVTIWGILKQGVRDFVRAIREKFVAIAAEQTALGIIAALTGNFIAAAAHGLAAIKAGAVALGLSLAGFQKGAVFERPTVIPPALVAEGGYKEAFLPLSPSVFKEIGAGIVNALSVPTPTPALAGASIGGDTIQVDINFDRVYIREDEDITRIARETHDLWRSRMRGIGRDV